MALSDDLISWWTLDEASGSTRVDSHGSHDLSDVNSNVGQASPGKVGDAADFPASGTEILRASDDADFQVGTGESWTWAMWVRADSAGTARRLVQKKDSATDADYDFRGGGAFASPDVGFLSGGSLAAVSATGTLGSGTWHLVVAWWDDAAGELGIRLDDDADDTTTTGLSPPGSVGPDVDVGRNTFGDANGWDGGIDELAFWKRALSSSERDELWNGGDGLTYTDVVSGVSPISGVSAGGAGAAAIVTGRGRPGPAVAASSSSSSAAIAGRVASSGVAGGASSPGGIVVGRGVLEGASSGAAAAIAAAVGRGRLTGVLSSSAAAVASIVGRHQVAGVAGGAAEGRGDATGVGTLVGVSGSASGGAGAAGRLTGRGVLRGVSSSVAEALLEGTARAFIAGVAGGAAEAVAVEGAAGPVGPTYWPVLRRALPWEARSP